MLRITRCCKKAVAVRSSSVDRRATKGDAGDEWLSKAWRFSAQDLCGAARSITYGYRGSSSCLPSFDGLGDQPLSFAPLPHTALVDADSTTAAPTVIDVSPNECNQVRTPGDQA